MAKRRKDTSPPPSGNVVRRPRGERKRLPPDLEAFARGDERALRRPRRPRLRDPRTVALVPGVANRDARRVHDARVARVTAAREQHAKGPTAHARAELARELCEAVMLGLWRGRSITGFDAFAEQIVELDASVARELAEEGARALGVPCEPRTDEGVAMWMRVEAAMLEAGVRGRALVRPSEDGDVLSLEVAVDDAPAALTAIGRRMVPIARDRGLLPPASG